MKKDYEYIITFFIGILIGYAIAGIIDTPKLELLNSNTLIMNESDDWYWLQSQQYTQQQLNEYYALKDILINNECTDGGFIENVDGKEFLIVCYEGKKIIKGEKQ